MKKLVIDGERMVEAFGEGIAAVSFYGGGVGGFKDDVGCPVSRVGRATDERGRRRRRVYVGGGSDEGKTGGGRYGRHGTGRSRSVE